MSKPGPPVTGEPDAFEYLTDGRLTNNPNITRMPTTQREWGTFIRELNKWVKNETGIWSPIFTGFSADPTDLTYAVAATCWWHRYGQMVHLQFNFDWGTSDDNDFSITNLPDIITPRDDQQYHIRGLMDNNAVIDTGSIEIKSTGVINFYTTEQTGTWTALSNKGFVTQNVTKASLIYSLRSPEKL